MHKLFKIRTPFFSLKIQKSLKPISHYHNSSKTQLSNSNLDLFTSEEVEIQAPSDAGEPSDCMKLQEKSMVQISHPWPEWVDLMECLLKKGYFEAVGDGNAKESNRVRTACLNFARDSNHLIRYLSRKDIRVIVGCGCPSTDRKVVNSGKRLRAHVKIDEGNVCSSCSLRGNCERAYVKAREGEDGRTIDVMRILLTYGLDFITDSVENKHCLNKITKESVRRLLKQMVEYSTEGFASDHPEALRKGSSHLDHLSAHGNGPIKVPMKQGDWHCPKCNFLNFARNIKCLRCNGLYEEKVRQIREDQEHLPLKKGDWICDKCNFLNFAKNTRCLLCKEKPPKRQLNPGEWECESCNYINFRRNMICLKCDHRRPKASGISSTTPQPQLEDGENCNSRKLLCNGGADEVTHEAFLEERYRPMKYSNKTRFVDDEVDDEDSQRDGYGFMDFPIKGGKSEISRDAQKKESWKVKMLEGKGERVQDAKKRESLNQKMLKRSEKDEWEDNISTIQRRAYLLGSSDDEDIAEWFGHKKSQTDKL